jgi:plastocyanin
MKTPDRQMTNFPLLAGAYALLALALPLHATETQSIQIRSVEIQKFAFAPKEITVAPGTTVAWTNRDETPHTISAPDQHFVSKAMDTDDRVEYTFTSEGDFTYFCTLHPFMTGIVHVRK